MLAELRTLVHKIWRTMVSVETGVVLLILVGILSAVGTIVLQRPVTRPDEMQSAYSPMVLRVLDAAGLTDVFHSWWFLGLVFLVSVCIVAASIDRLPSRWRYFSRPYKYPDERFRRANHPQRSLALASREAGEESGLAAAERALQSRGYNPERVAWQDHLGIFAEKHRISELAVYIVHSSLLLIFFGTIVDGLWGWRGTINLNEGQSSNIVEMRDGQTRALPFSIRCDAAGRENYKDGTAKRLWSRLAVVKAGQDMQTKEIVVNDPLLYGGVRFYQSSYGANGHLTGLEVSHEPGQWWVWSGLALLGVGLAFAFYLVHMRIWVVPVRDPKTGKPSLWIGGSANRNRDGFEERFNDLAASIEKELKRMTSSAPNAQLAMAADK
ncbi:MAG: cytochrome c biogenesis protein ResB [Terracidiphilus sp.]